MKRREEKCPINYDECVVLPIGIGMKIGKRKRKKVAQKEEKGVFIHDGL
jgi:hypothetical protein